MSRLHVKMASEFLDALQVARRQMLKVPGLAHFFCLYWVISFELQRLADLYQSLFRSSQGRGMHRIPTEHISRVRALRRRLLP